MKILWHSSSPASTSGYSNITRELTKRLRADGHTIRIGTKHPDHGWYEHDGFEIFEGTNTRYVNKMIEDEGFDFVFTLWDIWLLNNKRQYPKDKWCAYVPVDTEKISDVLAAVCKNTGMQIAMSKHGERELRSIGLDPLYAPHGIDTSIFKPKPKARKAFRDELGLTDNNFVIGSVGLNYGDDRKGFIPLMRAFKIFHDMHPEARLYIHSLANETHTQKDCINYHKIAENLGIGKWLIWPPQDAYVLNRITPEWLADVYNGFDIFCLPTKGEGWCLPLAESMACGIPVITTDTTTGPELVGKTGWLIDVNDDDLRWLPNGTWRYEPRPSAIVEQLEQAYYVWKNDDDYYQILKKQARAFALTYDWDIVYPKYWKPVFRRIEQWVKAQKKARVITQKIKDENPDKKVKVIKP